MAELTNEEILALIEKAVAEAKASAVAANAAAATANAAADQASSGAAAGVAGARTQSNVEQALAKAIDTAASLQQAQVESDIDTPESLKAGVVANRSAWDANNKRTYDVHQTEDSETRGRNRTHFDALISQQLTHIANLNSLTLQAIANNQNQSNLVNTGAINHQALAVDRQWNINETDLSAKSAAVLTDMILAKAAVAPKESA